jgi:cobalt/nickel transport protein
MAMDEPRAFSHISSHGGKKSIYANTCAPSSGRVAITERPPIVRPRELVRSLGDHIFVLEPEPYLETEENVYIQQFTKLIVNVGGVPGNWAEPQGLPVEAQPLSKPYANWTGGVFRALVLADEI